MRATTELGVVVATTTKPQVAPSSGSLQGYLGLPPPALTQYELVAPEG